MRRIIASLLLICWTLTFIACKELPSADVIVSGGIAAEPELPSGKIYSKADSEDESGYISEKLLTSLYGEGQPPAAISEAYDYAFFLSDGKHPCEVAVFLCSSDDAAEDIAMTCFRRAEIIKAAWVQTQYAALLSSAEVTVLSLRGTHIVVMTVCSDNESVLSAIKKTL